jgi:myo-inositol-1(or 4)-monophosphatase
VSTYLDDALSALTALAEEAGTIAHARYGAVQTGDISYKSEVDLVTTTDYEIETLLRDRLSARFPDAIFVGEESGADDADYLSAARALVVDPLDGTANFVHGIPYYSISLALIEEGQLRAGVVAAPELGAVYAARRGGGAFCNGAPISVSTREPLSSALASTGFAAVRYRVKPDNMALFAHMAYLIRGIRRFGSAAIDLCYVADGRIDLFWEYGLHDWDVAAGALILREAGGRVSTISGEERVLGAGNILGTNGRVHREFLDQASQIPQH